MTILGPAPVTPVFSGRRWAAIDALRGLALVAMIFYHFSWDLSFYGFIRTDVANDPTFRRIAAAIAASFLTLVGVGFAFAAVNGLDRERYLRRLMTVGGAALLVTLATSYAMPHAPVLFGILHNIALSSVLVLPFLRAPVAVVAAAAAAMFALPNFVYSSRFDGAAWAWLGLSEMNVLAVDHVPMLPWSGFVLLGLGLGRVVLQSDPLVGLRERLRDWRATSAPARLLVAMGRWSLVIYLTHQIVLMGLLWPFAPGATLRPASDETANFRNACEQTCQPNLGGVAACRAYCDCATDKLKAMPYWPSLMKDQLKTEERQAVSDIARQCLPTDRRAPN